MENVILRGQYLNREELERVFVEIANAMLAVIRSSKLNREEQADLQRNLASIEV